MAAAGSGSHRRTSYSEGGTLGRVTSSGSVHFAGEGPPRGLLGVEGENIEARCSLLSSPTGGGVAGLWCWDVKRERVTVAPRFSS